MDQEEHDQKDMLSAMESHDLYVQQTFSSTSFLFLQKNIFNRQAFKLSSIILAYYI